MAENRADEKSELEFDFSALDAAISTAGVSSPETLVAAGAEPAKFAEPGHLAELAGKFIAIDAGQDAKQPFVLIPAGIYARLPAWIWPAVAISLVVMIVGMMYLPNFRLSRLASKLGDGDLGVVQSAMKELIVSGDERAVTRLYDLAASRLEAMPARLRAIDTLGLIPHRSADNVLLRLEFSEQSESPIREAAGAARKQRLRKADRPRYR